MANAKYCVTLFKALKDSKRRYNRTGPCALGVYVRFDAERLVHDLDGRELIARFTDKIYTHKEPIGNNVYDVNCVLLAKQVGILGYFTKNDLRKSELSIDKDDLWMVKQLYKTGNLFVVTDHKLQVFKSHCKSEVVRKAFTERYFAKYDLSLTTKPGHWRDNSREWFIQITETNDE